MLRYGWQGRRAGRRNVKGDTKMEELKIDFEKVKTVEDVIFILTGIDLRIEAESEATIKLKDYLKEAKE